jgi:8-oxo-dGTP pyrophosphatase MutT (NUDIX family)
MVEPDDAGQPLAATAAAELAEEVGVRLSAATVGERGRTIGLAHDLARLRPDVVVHLPLGEDEWASRSEPGDAELSEMAECRWVPLTSDGIADFWRTFPPEAVTPPLAGAVALLDPR